MKRILLQIVLALCIVPMQAQKTSSKKYMDNDDIHYGMVKWGERKLRWDDFRGKKPMLSEEKKVAYLSLYAETKECKKKVDGIVYKYNGYDTYMLQDESWIDHNNMNESVLKHYQNQFDLWECLAREYIINVTLETNGVAMTSSFSRLREQFEQQARAMDKKTNNGENKVMVDSMAEYLHNRLHGTELDPARILEGYVDDDWALAYDFAFTSHFPFSNDYQKSAPYGFGAGISIYAKKIVFGLDFDLDFGAKCRKTVYADDGNVDVGDDLVNGGFTTFCGYTVKKNRSLALTPYIGLGVRCINGGEKYQEEHKKYIVTNGASFGIGVMTDFIFKRTINTRSVLWSVSKIEQSIRLNPYLSFTDFANGIGWIPAINIAVAYNFKGGGMKKRRNLIQ